MYGFWQPGIVSVQQSHRWELPSKEDKDWTREETLEPLKTQCRRRKRGGNTARGKRCDTYVGDDSISVGGEKAPAIDGRCYSAFRAGNRGRDWMPITQSLFELRRKFSIEWPVLPGPPSFPLLLLCQALTVLPVLRGERREV